MGGVEPVSAKKINETMKEPKTKLVCNLKPGEMFRMPNYDGEWIATGRIMAMGGNKYYECKNEQEYVVINPARLRVELIQKPAARKKEGTR